MAEADTTKTVTLTLTEKEAQTLAEVLGNVGGTGQDAIRTWRVSQALAKEGFECTDLTSDAYPFKADHRLLIFKG